MHVESSDPAPFHPAIRVQFPPLSSDFIVIALARRCITLHAFPSRFVFLASTRAYSAVLFPARVVFAFSAAPAVRFHLFSFPLLRVRIAFPCAFLPIEPVRPEYFRWRSPALRRRREPVCTRTQSIPHSFFLP